MTAVQIIIIIFTGLSALFWLLQLIAVLRTIKTMPLLEKMPNKALENPPKISVIIPACNEAQTLEKAMELRLQDNYPNLEFILIDDRSDDNTRDIAAKIAGKDKRVKLVCIDELPEGWLGKVHALHQGAKRAAGDWFLLSDADVSVKPGTLNRVMAYCQSEKLDHLAVLFEFYRGTFFVDMVVSVFVRALIAWGRTWKIKDPESRAFGGAGAFTLVRRTALEKTKGFEWLKMEVVDDLTLGQMIKRTGGGSEMINGRGYVGVCWYDTFGGMAAGLGRAVLVGLPALSPTRLILVSSIFFLLDMLPYAVLVPLGVPFLQIIGVVIVLAALSSSILAGKFVNRPLLPSLFMPLGNIIVFFISLKSAASAYIKKGITWRGTFYSIESLKKGRRFHAFGDQGGSFRENRPPGPPAKAFN